ncbi:MAG: dihydropteroate synthase [Rickettsiales bacterium]|nr:dihydropteroate synthase [Rickettsiales bacterium]
MKIIGILNITPDSFSDGGKFNDRESALRQVKNLVDQGADIIDVGAESTRPGAQVLSYQQEWQRLESILSYVIDYARTNNVEVSLDSYHPENIAKGLDLGIDYINDVSAAQNEEIIQLASESGCKLVLNHNLGIPADKTKLVDPRVDIIKYLNDWYELKLEKFTSKGVDRNKIILDVGIGFGKSSKQSFEVLERIEELKSLGCELYVGHSRKSFLADFDKYHFFKNEFVNLNGSKDYLTDVLTKYLSDKIDYVRVHDVKLAKS